MASITLDRIDVGRGEVRYSLSADSDASSRLWDCRELVISSSAPFPTDEADLASVFFLALAPLGWITGVHFHSRYPLASSARDSLNDVGAFVSQRYGWSSTDPFAAIRCTTGARTQPRRSALMFSGGVDSLSALCQLRGNVGVLLHLSNFDYESCLLTPAQRAAGPALAALTAEREGLDLVHVETNLAGLIRHADLDQWFPGRCTFWYGLQHVNHIAVAGAVLGESFAAIHVAGSVDEQHERYGSWASSPLLINRYRVGSPLRVFEHGVMRLRKIEYLLDHDPESLARLRVCYTSGNGTCETCGKCMWTALMIVASGGSLSQTPFPPGIRSSLRAVLDDEIRGGTHRIPMFEQSLSGRVTSGTRYERLRQLRARVSLGA